MEAPLRIFFVGNSPQGGKLRAHFQGKSKDIPSSIRVKGTNDNQPVKLRKNNKGIVTGRWTSKNKYPNRVVTLQLIDCGVVVMECKYNSCGDLIVDNPNVTINPTSSITTANGVVNFVWTSVVEEALEQYASEKKVGTSDWDAFDGDEPEGAGSTYYSTDNPTASATIDYRLKAIFTDGSEKILMNQTLNVVVPPTKDVAVENFNGVYNPDTFEIEFIFRSLVEVSLVSYTIQLKKSTATDYFDAITISPVSGPLTTYPPYSTFVDEGTYSARLIGVFNDNSTKVAATKDNIVVPAF